MMGAPGSGNSSSNTGSQRPATGRRGDSQRGTRGAQEFCVLFG